MSSRFRPAMRETFSCPRIWPFNRRRATSRRSKLAARKSKRRAQRREQQAALLKRSKASRSRSNAGPTRTATCSAGQRDRHLQGASGAGYNVEPDDINLLSKLDRIEKYTVRVKFAEDLATEIKVWVAPDPKSKVAIEAAQKARAAEEPAAQ